MTKSSRTRVESIATRRMTRKYMTAVASAIPAGFGAARLFRSEPLGKRLGHRGRAVGAADQGGGDGPVALAENAVGDIAEERKAGDQHDHQPQLLRVPCAVRTVSAVGQERQHRAGDHRIAGQRLDVVGFESLDEAVHFRRKARSATATAAQAIARPGLPLPARKPMAMRHQRGNGAGRIALALELGRVGDDHDRDRSGGERARRRSAGRARRPVRQFRRQARASRRSGRRRPASPGFCSFELPAALDADQQSAGQRRGDRQALGQIQSGEPIGMPAQMIGHEGRDEIIAVVVAGLRRRASAAMPAFAQASSSSSGLSSLSRNGSASPMSTSISGDPRAVLDQARPRRAGATPRGRAEIAGQRLLPPRHLARRDDRRERRDAAEPPRMAQRDRQRAMPAHRMAGDRLALHVDREFGGDQRRQLLGDVGPHAVIGRPRRLASHRRRSRRPGRNPTSSSSGTSRRAGWCRARRRSGRARRRPRDTRPSR